MEKMYLISWGDVIFDKQKNAWDKLLFYDQLSAVGSINNLFDQDKFQNGVPQKFLDFQTALTFLRLTGFFQFADAKEESEFVEKRLTESGIYTPNKKLTEDDSEEFDMITGIAARATAELFSRDYDVTISEFAYNRIHPKITKKEQVIRLVFNKLPRLRYDVEIERFLEFKRDPDTKLKLSALHNWIAEVSHTEFTQSEIEDKFDYLYMQYIDHMDRAKLKYSLNSGEFWITAIPEILDDLAHLKLGSAAKAVFQIFKKDLYLTHQERVAPGKELAFIYKSQKEFGD